MLEPTSILENNSILDLPCAHDIGPKGQIDGKRPMDLGMEKCLASCLSNVMNSFLSNIILEVSIDTTVENAPVLGLTCCNEPFIYKSAIVTMILLDNYPMIVCKTFKCLVGLYNFG
jgi:hypothetical protein